MFLERCENNVVTSILKTVMKYTDREVDLTPRELLIKDCFEKLNRLSMGTD